MAREPRTPRAVAGPTPTRRSHAGRIAAAAIGVASATGVGFGLNQPSQPTAVVSSQLLPDSSKTPGATDPNVTDANVCAHNWAPGAPPQPGGSKTYSQAARDTSEALKDRAFSNYGLVNPHNGGQSYEVDHRIPLSLGGRDEIENLWPETRTSPQFSAYVKDRLEYKLYKLVCAHQVSLADAQNAFRGDWTDAYQRYCADDADCPQYGNGGSDE